MSPEELRVAIADDLLAWWLNGTYDESMAEWWATGEASETAIEVVDVVLQSVTSNGFRIEERP